MRRVSLLAAFLLLLGGDGCRSWGPRTPEREAGRGDGGHVAAPDYADGVFPPEWGCPEVSYPFTFSCAPEGIERLHEPVLSALVQVATAYQAETGESLRVTSGWRSLRHTAELMAGFSQKQLEGMYCRSGYPDYIRQIVRQRRQAKGRLSAEAVYEILCRRQGGYISWHLQGGAVDISTEVSRPDLLRQLLQAHHFNVFDETFLGIACFHATYRGLSPVVIRE